MYKIGIDPGVKTGFAVSEHGVLLVVKTLDFWSVYDLINRDYNPTFCEIHIEDTSKMAVWHSAKNKNTMSRIGKNVGMVIREAELMIIGLSRLGYRVIPHQNKKFSKIDSKTFKGITGWDKRTSQHARDAACLVI